MADIPEIDLSDPAVLADPFTAYGQARVHGALARLVTPGFGAMWAVTRYADAKAMLTDPRFELRPSGYLRPDVPEHCRKYLHTMQEKNGPEHARLRRLVTPSFTARRAIEFRPRIERIVEALLDDLPASGEVDLLDLARPLPIDLITELVGIPVEERAAWREYGVAIAAGHGAAFAEAIPAIMRDASAAIAHRTGEPGLLTELIAGDADEVELVTFVWHLVLAGQVPTLLVTNAVHALLQHPDQLAALRADPSLMPRAIEELTRWCGPQLLSLPRFLGEDTEFAGVVIGKDEPVSAALASANRDPRVYTDPDRLDVRRSSAEPAHLAYAHGPHYCIGAALARVQTEVALSALLRRFPDLAPVDGGAVRKPDPGAWRLTELTVRLG